MYGFSPGIHCGYAGWGYYGAPLAGMLLYVPQKRCLARTRFARYKKGLVGIVYKGYGLCKLAVRCIYGSSIGRHGSDAGSNCRDAILQ
jgi:hypothetical protein